MSCSADRVTAEGVETEQVRRHPEDAGCPWAQGWLVSAAVPGTALRHLLCRLGSLSPATASSA